MLLLVLILVLAAFALLVLALVQGSVLWAWLSVAISVGAASVLLVDWWQRQQAARDDEELPPPAPDPAVGAVGAVGVPDPVDAEPVTEFIPIMPRRETPDPAPPDGENLFLPKEQQGASAESSANERTVLLPVARPPGSAEQPPGAALGTPPWSPPSSQSVTDSGPPAGPPAWSAGPPVGEETVLRPGDGPPPPAEPAAPAQREDPDGPTNLFTVASEGAPALPTRVPGQADGPARAAADRPPAQQPAAEAPARAEGDERAALPPLGPDGEPPEEPHDPAAAAVTASADDEVIVVDERPRYHVDGCTFLPGRPLIPLPAREAVELGFSPCGWCRPNGELARRHQPASR